MAAAIQTSGLTRSFASGVAVDGLSIDVAPGEVLALLGPNGAGKTTTVRLLNGVLAPDRGTASVLGMDPTVEGHAIRQRTGVLTENAGLDERLTARENLLVVARLRHMSRHDAEKRADRLLGRFGMLDRSDTIVQGFSTGQRKRLALARALLHEPEVLFLDEPTSGLDPSATRDVIDLIGTLAAEHGRTVVLCTHFLGEAGRLADRIAIMHRGRLHAFGRPEDIAAELWTGLDVDLDLGSALDADAATQLRARAGVLAVSPTRGGATVRVRDRSAVPGLVADLVDLGRQVYAATPRPPTLEDVYFEVEARISAAEDAGDAGDAGTDEGGRAGERAEPGEPGEHVGGAVR